MKFNRFDKYETHTEILDRMGDIRGNKNVFVIIPKYHKVYKGGGITSKMVYNNLSSGINNDLVSTKRYLKTFEGEEEGYMTEVIPPTKKYKYESSIECSIFTDLIKRIYYDKHTKQLIVEGENIKHIYNDLDKTIGLTLETMDLIGDNEIDLLITKTHTNEKQR